MTVCCICGGSLYPPWNWREEWCEGCAVNFRAEQPPRPEADAPGLTPQQEALARLAIAHACADEEQRYAEACRIALRHTWLAEEDEA
jgi:hypothetical protein